MKNVVFHVGLPKCGSTAIQAALSQNAAYLRDHGVLYPKLPRPEKKKPGASQRRKYKKHPSFTQRAVEFDLIGEFDNGAACEGPSPVLADVLETFDISGCDTLVLSSEGFLGSAKDIKKARVGNLLDRYRVSIAVFIRQFDHLIEALYKQNIKGKSRLMSDFASFYAKREGSQGVVAGIPKRIIEIEKSLGGAATVFMLRPGSASAVDCFKEFIGLGAIDLPAQSTNPASPDGKFNVSLSNATSLFLRELNAREIPEWEFGEILAAAYGHDRAFAERYPITIVPSEISARLLREFTRQARALSAHGRLELTSEDDAYLRDLDSNCVYERAECEATERLTPTSITFMCDALLTSLDDESARGALKKLRDANQPAAFVQPAPASSLVAVVNHP